MSIVCKSGLTYANDGDTIEPMSTRSVIAKTTNDQTTGIYCHFDGYPEHVGEILVKHYMDPAKIDALIALGSLSVLAERVAPNDGEEHSFERKAKGVTVAYHRDRGEDIDTGETMPTADFMVTPPDMGQDYTYVFTDGEWMVRCRGQWRSVKQVLAESSES